MPVLYEYQTMIQCDICGAYEAEMIYKHHMIEKYRELGWKIGKRVTCPECVNRAKSPE